MSEYYITTDGELYHYGVKGMKWGVRRAQKALSKASSSRDSDRALSKLQKHRDKGSAELAKLKKLASERMLLFDEDLMTFAMGNCITMEDTNGNRKLLKKRHEAKIDAVAAMMDAFIAFKLNRDAFE